MVNFVDVVEYARREHEIEAVVFTRDFFSVVGQYLSGPDSPLSTNGKRLFGHVETCEVRSRKRLLKMRYGIADAGTKIEHTFGRKPDGSALRLSSLDFRSSKEVGFLPTQLDRSLMLDCIIVSEQIELSLLHD